MKPSVITQEHNFFKVMHEEEHPAFKTKAELPCWFTVFIKAAIKKKRT